MAERTTAKSKRAEGAKPAAKPVKAVKAADLEAENTRLRGELAAAQARIADLEQKQAEIINRIDWAIDSLHNLTE